jgi:hypothetical protein
LKKQRISTTISHKHWELLKKYEEKYKTQQKALEVALESLENSSKQITELTPEDKTWMRLKKEKFVCVLEKNAFRTLIRNANVEPLQEYIIQHKIMELSIEIFLQRPMKDISLKEVIDGLVSTGFLVNWYDMIHYTDESSHYTLLFTHSFGPNVSQLLGHTFESLFQKYGAKTEITISPVSIFVKVFK